MTLIEITHTADKEFDPFLHAMRGRKFVVTQWQSERHQRAFLLLADDVAMDLLLRVGGSAKSYKRVRSGLAVLESGSRIYLKSAVPFKLSGYKTAPLLGHWDSAQRREHRAQKQMEFDREMDVMRARNERLQAVLQIQDPKEYRAALREALELWGEADA